MPSADEVRQYLANLGDLWRDADDEARQEMAIALFDRLIVFGFRELTYRWSATARAHRLDRLVAPSVHVDVGSLELPGRPTGLFLMKSEGPENAEGLSLAS